MPTYDYRCESCKKKFTVVQSISQHEKSRTACPRCKSRDVKQLITPFLVKTSRKS
ncbi:MAG: zinc ribbon domain-containing protein [Syntrophales bacterium]|nr:zinc ribbon domain-containing protein [Syntrophales bacterium]MDD5532238.1 zinc ribbon domain-containing protein [Syntrophales bacterium]HPL63103.1 zinc ribbon domain-containing protein [Syntrophales bacterium]